MSVNQRFVRRIVVVGVLIVGAAVLSGCEPHPLGGGWQTSLRRPDGLKATFVAHSDGTWEMHTASSTGAAVPDETGVWSWDSARRRFVASSDDGTRAQVRVSGKTAYVKLDREAKPLTVRLGR